MHDSYEPVKKSFSGKGVFPYQYAFTLLLPIRNIFLSPKQIIKRLHLADNNFVLEVGPGPGYFSSKIAMNIPNGKLIIADIQKEMLDIAKKRLSKKNINNVEYYLCSGRAFDLQSNYFDRIFLISVLGEVTNKEIYLSEFYRMLKQNGILSISELAGDPDKMSINDIKFLADKFNFSFSELFGTENNYTINFKKD